MTNRYLYGMHDPGDWFGLLAGAGLNGWCLYTVAVGCDQNDRSGQGLGVPGLIEPLVRLNNGYAPAGTIPHPNRYADFAQRCANFVAASQGCTHWIIGNEIAMNWEWPDGQPIRLQEYIDCFKLCRAAIKAVQPDAIVLPQPPAHYHDALKYPRNEWGDWCQQLTDMLNGIGVGNVDGIAIHAYTHGHNPSLVQDDAKMGAPFQDRHYHFRAYRDFMQAIPVAFRQLPVFITEANPCEWQDTNNGWIQAAYAEINAWNNTQGNQPIHCLCFYRWQTEDDPRYHIRTRSAVVADFQQALQHRYSVPESIPAATVLYMAYVVAASGLNLRAEPNAHSPILTTLPFATAVSVLKEYAGWCQVQVNGALGWLFSGFLGRNAPRQNDSPLDLILEEKAKAHNLDPRLVKAVIRVESNGYGFINGRLLVRFEPRVWLTMRLPAPLREAGKRLFQFEGGPGKERMSLDGAWVAFHGNQDLEHMALTLASAIDTQSALESASYGLTQVMGFNFATVGYPNVQAMVDDFNRGEEAHVEAFFTYCEKRRDVQGSALDALRRGDYVAFARLYNGIGQEAYYASRIQQALNG